jgi:methionine-rich copper-binding protein CopC
MLARKHQPIINSIALVAVLLISARALEGHAILLEATPAKNASVTGPDIQILLKFNARIDGARSQVSLVLPDSTVRKIELDKQKSPEILSANPKGLKAGAYKLRWQVLASDGHITRGEYPFEVK